jgi:acyl carrier protein
MTTTIEQQLVELAAAFLKADASKLNLDMGVGDFPTWDSFAQVGLIAQVETVFDLAFDVEEITMFETLRDIHEAIEAKLAATQ